MNRTLGMKLAVALLSIGGAGAAATMATAPDNQSETPHQMQVIVDDGSGDRVEIEDLADLEVGDSRSYQTESGRPVTVTRDEEGFSVDVDGKQVRIGDGPEHLAMAGTHGRQMKRIEIDGGSESGEAKSFVISDSPGQKVIFLEGREGAHGFAFSGAGDDIGAPHELMTEALLERLGKSEKFLSLDDATQEIVREAIRESAPEAHWISLTGPDHDGKEGAMKVIVRERVHQSEKKSPAGGEKQK